MPDGIWNRWPNARTRGPVPLRYGDIGDRGVSARQFAAHDAAAARIHEARITASWRPPPWVVSAPAPSCAGPAHAGPRHGGAWERPAPRHDPSAWETRRHSRWPRSAPPDRRSLLPEPAWSQASGCLRSPPVRAPCPSGHRIGLPDSLPPPKDGKHAAARVLRNRPWQVLLPFLIPCTRLITTD